MKGCPFCHIADERMIAYDELTFTMRDIYPVSPGHTLVIPKCHVASFFDATDEEQTAILAAIKDAKRMLDKEFHPQGYNVGINTGAAAGQTVMHAHVHLIPRYEADTPKPQGGIRHCIPGKGDYETETK
jgi:diadenosine tetraphosphate (Ap4A) HIT family hydrolase